MAVYGVGAFFDKDVSGEFLDRSCFFLGYYKNEATTLFEMLSRAKVGDILFIKSFQPQHNDRLRVKAIGFVTGHEITNYSFEGRELPGREIKWVRDYSDVKQYVILEKHDRVNNVYANTMYEEYSPSIIKQLINWIAAE